MSIYESLMLVLTAAGLIGLWFYVTKTSAIAKAAQEQNDIIYRPAITVELSEFEEKYLNSNHRPWEHIRTIIKNHTTVHASLRIVVQFRLKSASSDKYETFKVKGGFYGGDAWDFAAKANLIGGFKVPKELRQRGVMSDEILIMDVDVESSPLDLNKYLRNPRIRYVYNHEAKRWIPYAVPLD